MSNEYISKNSQCSLLNYVYDEVLAKANKRQSPAMHVMSILYNSFSFFNEFRFGLTFCFFVLLLLLFLFFCDESTEQPERIKSHFILNKFMPRKSQSPPIATGESDLRTVDFCFLLCKSCNCFISRISCDLIGFYFTLSSSEYPVGCLHLGEKFIQEKSREQNYQKQRTKTRMNTKKNGFV